MAKVLVVTSGKGGVGKTTTTAAVGAALAQNGKKVVVVDFDVGLRNLDLVMGAERRVVFDLINVVQGVSKLSQALIRDKRLENLWPLPASQTRDKDAARGEMLSIEDVLEILATPLLGIVPESQDVLRASNVGSPVTLSSPASSPARAYLDATRRLLGETVAMSVPAERVGLMNRLLGRRAA